jgi:hypothetical protein
MAGKQPPQPGTYPAGPPNGQPPPKVPSKSKITPHRP